MQRKILKDFLKTFMCGKVTRFVKLLYNKLENTQHHTQFNLKIKA